MTAARLDPDRIDAVLLDLDGVLTDTAALHARAWKSVFDRVLEAHPEAADRRPFDAEAEYRRRVDGLPRLDGVRAFLEGRGLDLPEGAEDAAPGLDSVRAVAAAKNARFLETLRAEGPAPRPGGADFLRRARAAGLGLAIVTASRNGPEVIAAAGLDGLCDALVDGNVAARLELRGKPAPDTFLEAARRLGAAPARTAVIEDAEAGVAAARAGGFALALGLGPPERAGALRAAGAHAVAADLSEVEIADGAAPTAAPDRLALDRLDEIAARLGPRPPAVFLDYDGTLTPIADRPEQAVLGDAMRESLAALARRCPVCVVSGRGLEELERMTGLDSLAHAGAHGFDIRGPAGSGLREEKGGAYVARLREAAAFLREALEDVPGVLVEDKRHAVAVHWRLTPEEQAPRVDRAVEAALARWEGLRRTGGKKIHELRPDIPWDKGRAVLRLIEALGLEDRVPVYVGDDETDRDAFRALRGRGVTALVSDRPEAADAPDRADYRLRDPGEVRRFLDALARMAEEAAA